MSNILLYGGSNVILVFYFLYKTIRSKQPIFLLGIPFLQFMDRAIFFEKERYYWTLFTGLNDIWAIVFTLLIVWFINIVWNPKKIQNSLQSFSLFKVLKLFRGEIPIILLFILWLFNTGMNLIRFPDVSETLITSFGACSIFLGYFLLRAIIANTDLLVIKDFIESLCFITTISAFLFFLHQALNINIFAWSSSDDMSFAGGIVRRSTFYFPPLTFLLFSFGLATRKWNIFVALSWMLALLSYIFSYTRTYIIGALFLIFCSFILKGLKFRSLKFVGNLLVVIFGLTISGWLSSIFLPVQSSFLVTRLSQGFVPFTSDSNNLAVRWKFITNTWEMIKPDFFIGIGSPGIINFPGQFWTMRWVWDTWIVMALQYWGIIGISLIALLFYSALRHTYKYYISGDENIQFFGLLFTLIFIAVLIEGIFGPIFMEYYRYPLGFWYFAFLYGIASKIKMKEINTSYSKSSSIRKINAKRY